MKRQRGFTLIEVTLALALLGLGLVVLLRSTAGNIMTARNAQMLGVVTDLARAKMYDIEETLLKDGFGDSGLADPEDECTDFEKFDDEGWPNVEWCAQIIQIKLPSFQDLQALTQAAGSAAAAGSGSGSGSNAFADSALGGMLSMFGGGMGSGDVESAAGGMFIQSQFQMFQDILTQSIRKVVLTVRWEVGGSKRDMQVVAFFTDPGSMDKVLQGMGAADLDDVGSGSGTGSAGGGTGSSGTGRGSSGTGGTGGRGTSGTGGKTN